MIKCIKISANGIIVKDRILPVCDCKSHPRESCLTNRSHNHDENLPKQFLQKLKEKEELDNSSKYKSRSAKIEKTRWKTHIIIRNGRIEPRMEGSLTQQANHSKHKFKYKDRPQFPPPAPYSSPVPALPPRPGYVFGESSSTAAFLPYTCSASDGNSE